MPLLKLERTLVLVVDFQARLMPAISEGEARMASARKTLQAARLLGAPIVVTEQNPKGLGSTVEGLLFTARHARLLPGDGGIELRAQFDALRKPVPVSIELPNDAEKAKRGIEAWATAAIEAARNVLAGWP